MQLATMQLFACSMQLATKAITTAIKLATCLLYTSPSPRD